jgi:ribosomal protein S20
LKTLERRYLDLVEAGRNDEAKTLLGTLNSALDKAANAGAVHQRKADRKKSRLSLRLRALK